MKEKIEIASTARYIEWKRKGGKSESEFPSIFEQLKRKNLGIIPLLLKEQAMGKSVGKENMPNGNSGAVVLRCFEQYR